MTSRITRAAVVVSGLLLVFVLLSGCSAQPKLASLPLTREQKVQDFRYLAQVFLDNYPYLWAAQRKTGFDWPAHVSEFEQEIAATETDEEFALEIAEILGLLNNGHTGIAYPGTASAYGSSLTMGRWREEVRKTTLDRVEYWYGLSKAHSESSSFESPFCAVYAAGEYVVVSVSPEAIQAGLDIQPGWTVTAIGGQPVSEYVKNMLRSRKLLYDPVRDCLYLRELPLPRTAGDNDPGTFSASFRTRDGDVVERALPMKVGLWDPSYYWPPRYKDASATTDQTGNLFAIMLDRGVGYVRVGSMARDYKGQMSLLRRFLSEQRPQALIIDVRGNGGGSDNYWEALVSMLAPEPVMSRFAVTWRSGEYVKPFIEQKVAVKLPEMSRSELDDLASSGACVPPEVLTPAFVLPRAWDRTIQPNASLNYRGKICLLVDDYVFSSAESFAAFCKGSKWATVIGSFTGGDGIGFDPALVTLPNSGMLIRFPLDMGLNPDLTANEEKHTIPDILVEWGPEDLLRYVATRGEPGRPDPEWDPQLRAALEWIAGK